ncbi:unnamed protein product [Meloidogyne enterolobii]|uniref:Uncharacterized protein n=1 Tax=Meloidogyne enterolobii TaxID=390850 RepID=A0ACB1AJY8_MELEN
MTLLNIRIFLELYKKLSLKLGYLNLEYDEQIDKIINKIQYFTMNNYKEYLNPTDKNLDEKNEEIKKYEIKLNGIIKNFIKGKIKVDIIKVSLEEGFQYIGYDIKKLKDLGFKSEVLTDEVNMGALYNHPPPFLECLRSSLI